MTNDDTPRSALDWSHEARAGLRRYQTDPDEQVVLELAQHAAAAFERERADDVPSDEAARRIREQLEIWCRNVAAYPRRQTPAAAVTAPPIGSSRFSGWLQDVRYGLRLLKRQPAFTLAAVVTTALGIGAVGTLFSVAYGVLLKPQPWPEPDRLIRVWETRAGATRSLPPVLTNRTDYAWRDRAETIAGIGGFSAVRDVTLDADGTRVPALPVTPGLLQVLAVQPALGSIFTDDGRERPAREIILSHALWRDRFGAATDTVGRQVLVDGAAHLVVGVMPAAFQFPNPDVRAWLPHRIPVVQTLDGTTQSVSMFGAIARLRPGVTPSQAAAEAASRASGGPKPGLVDIAVFGTKGDAIIHAMTYPAYVTREVREPVIAFLAAVALLFVTAVASVSSMQLARATARRREMALRAAIGAGTGRLARQMFVESALLGLIGGAAGLGLTVLLHAALPWLMPADFPRLADVTLDWRIAALSGLIALAAGLAFGLLPAWQMRRLSLLEVLTEDSLAPVGIAGRSLVGRTRALIMAGQVAIASFLLVGAVLLGRTFTSLWTADRGYQPANMLTMRVMMPDRLFKAEARSLLLGDLMARIDAMPGVRSSGFTTILPLGGVESLYGFKLPKRDGRVIEAQASVRTVSAGYLKSIGARLVAGRDFTDADTLSSPPVVIVNRTFVRTYLDGDGVGTTLPVAFQDEGRDRWQVAGVVEDVQPASRGEPARPEVFISYRQITGGLGFADPFLVVRSEQDPAALVAAIRSAAAAVHRGIHLDSIMTMENRLMTSLARPRLYAVLLGGFAGLALLIAGVGLYGVLAYGVAQRHREIGVRAALGATPGGLVRLVLRQGVAITVAGLAVGLTGAYVAAGSLSGFLFGVDAHDPVSFAAVPVVLLAVAVLAAFVPARRAATIDPLQAMRS
jgi:predicted permease